MVSYRETGRVVAALMSDEVFLFLAYGASNRHHLLAGIDEFMDALTVLPPAAWDPSIRLEPPAEIPCQVKILHLFIEQKRRLHDLKSSY